MAATAVIHQVRFMERRIIRMPIMAACIVILTPSYQIPPQPWWELRNSNGQPYVGDYRFYSGYGGGVFCDANSNANFIACNYHK